MSSKPLSKHTYILDPESPAEMVRLIAFDQVTTNAMNGPLAEQSPKRRAAIHNILDVAYGPGGWVLDVAFTHPHIQVARVDISKTMIDYANARAHMQQIPNSSFGVMDINAPLDFSDASFDLVNARFINGVLRRENAPFVAECTRLLQPGEMLRLTEMVDVGVSLSPAFEQMSQ